MVDVVAEPERSFLDEPIFFYGQTAVTPRRLIYLLVIAVIAAIDALKMPSGPRIYLPALEVEVGILKLLGLLPALPFVYFFLVDRPVRPEAVLLYTLLGKKRQKAGKKRREQGEEERSEEEQEEPRVVEKRLRLRARGGVARFSFVVSVERPSRVQVLVDGAAYRELTVEAERQLLVELEPGEHTVEVRSVEPPALLARYIVAVEPG